MWIMTPYGLLSLCESPDDPQQLLVKARAPKPLERVFPGQPLTEDPAGDYPYRVQLPKTTVGQRIATLITEIDYAHLIDRTEPETQKLYIDIYRQCRLDQRRRRGDNGEGERRVHSRELSNAYPPGWPLAKRTRYAEPEDLDLAS